MLILMHLMFHIIICLTTLTNFTHLMHMSSCSHNVSSHAIFYEYQALIGYAFYIVWDLIYNVGSKLHHLGSFGEY